MCYYLLTEYWETLPIPIFALTWDFYDMCWFRLITLYKNIFYLQVSTSSFKAENCLDLNLNKHELLWSKMYLESFFKLNIIIFIQLNSSLIKLNPIFFPSQNEIYQPTQKNRSNCCNLNFRDRWLTNSSSFRDCLATMAEGAFRLDCIVCKQSCIKLVQLKPPTNERIQEQIKQFI